MGGVGTGAVGAIGAPGPGPGLGTTGFVEGFVVGADGPALLGADAATGGAAEPVVVAETGTETDAGSEGAGGGAVGGEGGVGTSDADDAGSGADTDVGFGAKGRAADPEPQVFNQGVAGGIGAESAPDGGADAPPKKRSRHSGFSFHSAAAPPARSARTSPATSHLREAAGGGASDGEGAESRKNCPEGRRFLAAGGSVRWGA